MPITQLGAINTTALLVPDVYVQIVPPQTTLLNGVPTNVLGIVGTAQWGPVDTPVTVGSMQDFARSFGAIQDVQHDLGTAAAAAVLQGAANMRCVRVTDGNDAASTGAISDSAGTPADGAVVTAKYTGTLGNSIEVRLQPGSNSTVSAPTWKLVIAIPGQPAEEFDRISGTAADGSTEGSFWYNLIDAVNNGQNILRGASELVTLSVPQSNPSAALPVAAETITLTGGADGNLGAANAAAKTTAMVGSEVSYPHTGMYALKGSGASIVNLADYDNDSDWSTISAFGLSEGAYCVVAGAAGQSTVTSAVTDKKDASADSYSLKVMMGDWCYWFDAVNGRTRLLSPASFVAGRLAGLSPEQSTLNKPIYGLVGTQRSENSRRYNSAELQELAEGGVDVITSPSPGGEYFSCRIGHNASSNPVTNGDNYTRMTNYLASTFNAGLGLFIGRLQSVAVRRQAKNTLENFLSTLELQGQIGNAEGTTPFQVTIDSSNNPAARVALGYMQADVKVQYLSIIEKFLVNVEGGQSVTIERVATEPLA